MNRAMRRRFGMHKQRVCVIDNSKTAQPGWVENPLIKYPVDRLCFCGKKITYQFCCMKKTVRYVKPSSAKLLSEYMEAVRQQIDEEKLENKLHAKKI